MRIQGCYRPIRREDKGRGTHPQFLSAEGDRLVLINRRTTRQYNSFTTGITSPQLT